MVIGKSEINCLQSSDPVTARARNAFRLRLQVSTKVAADCSFLFANVSINEHAHTHPYTLRSRLTLINQHVRAFIRIIHIIFYICLLVCVLLTCSPLCACLSRNNKCNVFARRCGVCLCDMIAHILCYLHIHTFYDEAARALISTYIYSNTRSTFLNAHAHSNKPSGLLRQ